MLEPLLSQLSVTMTAMKPSGTRQQRPCGLRGDTVPAIGTGQHGRGARPRSARRRPETEPRWKTGDQCRPDPEKEEFPGGTYCWADTDLMAMAVSGPLAAALTVGLVSLGAATLRFAAGLARWGTGPGTGWT